MSPKPPAELAPLFLRLAGRKVLVVGGAAVALAKLAQLSGTGAEVVVVAPRVVPELLERGVAVQRRPFEPADLDGAWLVVAAATPEVNRAVAAEAERRCVFVTAVDDADASSAFSGGVVRRDGVTVAISTAGKAPALAGLLREGLSALLPEQLGAWLDRAEALRAGWKAQGVPLDERRPRLLRALNELYQLEEAAPGWRAPQATSAPGGGFVSLVGAGPGDPELLTVKALRRLEAADLVLYDALVSPEAVALARRAHCFFVGKRAGRPSVQQQTIHRLLIRAARQGKRVVRLKAGDPFVFGRGGEEAEALARAGVPHEVIPGLSSALAAPALAGIPLTHRGLASSFTVVSGHAEQAYRPVVAALPPASSTLVVLMGLGTRARLVEVLLQSGWDAATPAALLLGASSPGALTWTGPLAQLPQAPLPPLPPPGVLVIGPVVALSHAAQAPGRVASSEVP
jgi:uroporphyrin-III C-methyltransferase / precorrin-2 dehydrogenase / sirohydrochlorin ferrochelatase